jgi:hypothetical protein
MQVAYEVSRGGLSRVRSYLPVAMMMERQR